MTTKVRKLTGGVPSLAGDAGTTGQVLTKMSNTPGDYAWNSINFPIQSTIQSGVTYVTTATSEGEILFSLQNNGTSTPSFLSLTHKDISSSAGIYIDGLAGINNKALKDYENHEDASSTYAEQTDAENLTVNKSWTAEKILELAVGGVAVPAGVPVGTIAMWPSSDAPPSGWIFCHGQQENSTTYPELSSLLGIGWGTVAPGEFDLVSAGFFRVPDFRGVFPRGRDLGRGQDSNPGRGMGEYAADMFKSHTHKVKEGSRTPGGSGELLTSGDDYTRAIQYYSTTQSAGDDETAPKSISIEFIIKAA